jgi:hypothetical protein
VKAPIIASGTTWHSIASNSMMLHSRITLCLSVSRTRSGAARAEVLAGHRRHSERNRHRRQEGGLHHPHADAETGLGRAPKGRISQYSTPM